MANATATTRLSQRFPERRAFITGAASGLGRELVVQLGAAGWRLGLLDISRTGIDLVKAEGNEARGRSNQYLCG